LEHRKDGYHVYYAYHDGQSWSFPHRIAGGHLPAIACDFADKMHVVWTSNYVVCHSSGSDTSWSTPEEVFYSSAVRCVSPEIIFNEAGGLELVWTYRDEPEQAEIYYSSNQLTSREEQCIDVLPGTFQLKQNFPNPFNTSTTIRYQLYQPTKVNLSIYNVTGQHIINLVNEYQDAGYYLVSWNGNNQSGNMVASGIYLCHIQAGRYENTIRMLFLK
jgi:hypothetical protein